jgi:epoxide hydrolase 4
MRLTDLQVTHKSAHVNGVRLEYVEKGEGPLVVLLHGFPESWWSWRYQIDPLVKAGYRVIAPDQRGYAKSDKKGPYDIDTLVADICALIDHVAPRERKAIVVGHDWGGAIAWHLAATRPEHCTRLVVMNCPHPLMMERGLRSLKQLKKSWYMFFFQLPFLPERMLTKDGARMVAKAFRAGAVDRTNFGDEEIAPIREAALEPGAASGMIGWYRAMMRKTMLDRKKLASYPTIDVPSLLIWAKEDFALGYDELVPGTERFVRSLRIEPIERTGHFVQAENPTAVNALLLPFLAESRSKNGPTARA